MDLWFHLCIWHWKRVCMRACVCVCMCVSVGGGGGGESSTKMSRKGSLAGIVLRPHTVCLGMRLGDSLILPQHRLYCILSGIYAYVYQWQWVEDCAEAVSVAYALIWQAWIQAKRMRKPKTYSTYFYSTLDSSILPRSRSHKEDSIPIHEDRPSINSIPSWPGVLTRNVHTGCQVPWTLYLLHAYTS